MMTYNVILTATEQAHMQFIINAPAEVKKHYIIRGTPEDPYIFVKLTDNDNRQH